MTSGSLDKLTTILSHKKEERVVQPRPMRPSAFKETLAKVKEYEKYMQEENAKKDFDRLDKMIHPEMFT